MNRDDLKRWLAENQVTRTELGELLGVSRALVSAWTLGTREVPDWVEYAIGLKSLKASIRAVKKRK